MATRLLTQACRIGDAVFGRVSLRIGDPGTGFHCHGTAVISAQIVRSKRQPRRFRRSWS